MAVYSTMFRAIATIHIMHQSASGKGSLKPSMSLGYKLLKETCDGGIRDATRAFTYSKLQGRKPK